MISQSNDAHTTATIWNIQNTRDNHGITATASAALLNMPNVIVHTSQLKTLEDLEPIDLVKIIVYLGLLDGTASFKPSL